jgi:chromosome partitioning protein
VLCTKIVLLVERELFVKTVAIVNHKGGVGKTTTAVCLSGALVEQGRRVLLIDLDPQASASKWLDVNDNGRALLDTLYYHRSQNVPKPTV